MAPSTCSRQRSFKSQDFETSDAVRPDFTYNFFFPPFASWLSPGRSTRSIGMHHVLARFHTTTFVVYYQLMRVCRLESRLLLLPSQASDTRNSGSPANLPYPSGPLNVQRLLHHFFHSHKVLLSRSLYRSHVLSTFFGPVLGAMMKQVCWHSRCSEAHRGLGLTQNVMARGQSEAHGDSNLCNTRQD